MWLTRLNGATLTHLDVSELRLKYVQVVKDICRTISQLPCLKVLHLRSQSGDSLSLYAFESLFYSCPTSLVDLKVTCQISGDVSRYSKDLVVGDWGYDEGPLILRDAPLLHLKSLDIPIMPVEDLEQVFGTILGQCPALESLELPKLIELSDDMLFIIASIGELCPRISTLSFPEGCLAEHVTMVLDALPEQQLRNLCYRHHKDPDPEPMIATWTRHSTTLRRIEFTHAIRIMSSVIQAALTTCEGLEVFSATSHGDLRNICLIFANAIESEWVCRGIRELILGVWVTGSGANPEYMKDESKATWTDNNHRHWDDLGKFYSQIGALTRLEILDLRAVGQIEMSFHHTPEREYFISLNETCFPGLLALEDAEQGKIGYLSKLAGLTQLRELRGSFVWTQKDNSAMIGEQEVDWFVNHLPSLEMATFHWRAFGAPLQMLQLRRPRLRVCVNSS
ncbi:hypothetical protein BGZ96_006282 [Linnemannia gamsii]|uniref:F-box domain-containing protein n=1 Tax=Linnemannia gamsii TaxID=64522 RepID=A0ABQ7K3C2_9FUNG|nr:hypothetical protein BGZ96_006282 [Linnemannia gamsii]